VRHAGLGRARGPRRARPVPVVQGLLERLPRGRRHGAVQVRGAAPDLPRAAAPGEPLRARLAPRWTRIVTGVPGLARLANAALGLRPVARLVLAAGGMDTRRKMVSFASTPFRSWVRGEGAAQVTRGTGAVDDEAPEGARRPRVLLWTDSFSDGLS